MGNSKKIIVADEELYGAARLLETDATTLEDVIGNVLNALDRVSEDTKGKSAQRLALLTEKLRELQGATMQLGEQQKRYIDRYIQEVDYYDLNIYNRINMLTDG